MRLKLISCEVLYRELCFAIAQSPHQVDLEFLPKGLHDIGCVGMLQRLQTALNNVDTSLYDAVLFGYGLCNNGIVGLRAPAIPIVLPRAHDCMTLFLGGRKRYIDYFNNNPGTFFLTSGWIERGEAAGELRQLSIQHTHGMDMSFDELVARFGEDNAKYLYEELCDQTKHYSQLTFVQMGMEPNDAFQRHAEEKAREHGWKFEKIQGDMSLFRRLVNGEWDERDFLVVKPGWKVVVRYDDGIIAAENAEG